jgi:hypothetical protein
LSNTRDLNEPRPDPRDSHPGQNPNQALDADEFLTGLRKDGASPPSTSRSTAWGSRSSPPSTATPSRAA